MKHWVRAALLALLLSSTAEAAALLTWTDNSSIETGFRVYRAATSTGTFAAIGTVAANVKTFTDPAAMAGNCYKVTAFNSVGESGFSNTACVVSPSAPSNATVVIVP